jgi:hypothetical protein
VRRLDPMAGSPLFPMSPPGLFRVMLPLYMGKISRQGMVIACGIFMPSQNQTGAGTRSSPSIRRGGEFSLGRE